MSSEHDITIKPRERLCIFIDLMVVFGRPLLFSNPFEEDDSLCCFHDILRQKDMAVIEKIEFLNVQEIATTVKSGENLLSFRSVGLNAIPVYLIKESASSLKQRWLQDSDRTQIECSKQLKRLLVLMPCIIIFTHQIWTVTVVVPL